MRTRSCGWFPRRRVLAYPYKGYWSPADTVKERAQLEEMYHRGYCPWMIWDPERSGAAQGRRACARDLHRLGRHSERDRHAATCTCTAPSGGPLSVLAIGAHPDDIEIGAGGLLLRPGPGQPRVRYVVLTGTAERQQEARNAAQAFMPGADLAIELLDLPEGRLPAVWGA